MNFSELHFLEFTPSYLKWDEHEMNIEAEKNVLMQLKLE